MYASFDYSTASCENGYVFFEHNAHMFWVLYLSCNKNNPYSLFFHVVPPTVQSRITHWDEEFCSLLVSIRALRCHSAANRW
jgi:hypothetical protein